MIKFNTSEIEPVSTAFFAKVKAQLISNTLEDMCAYGASLMNKAYEDRKWKNRTFNLKDSFGWVVYSDGNIYKRGTIGDVAATTTKKIYGEELSGRDVLIDFVNNYSPIPLGAELVIVAAMPYGLWLETRYSYEVLSSIKDDLETAFNQPVKEIRT